MIHPNIGSDMHYIGPVLGYPDEAYLMYWDNTKTNIAVKKMGINLRRTTYHFYLNKKQLA